MLATFERKRVNLIKYLHKVLLSPFGDIAFVLAIPQVDCDDPEPGLVQRVHKLHYSGETSIVLRYCLRRNHLFTRYKLLGIPGVPPGSEDSGFNAFRQEAKWTPTSGGCAKMADVEKG